MKHPSGPQQIVIAGREVKWDQETISYENVVEEWNKLDPSRQIQGNPGISWENDRAGSSGIMYPSESIGVKDGLVFMVDAAHLS